MNFKQTAAFLAASTLLLSVAGCGKVPGMAQGASKVGMSYNAAAKRKAEKNGSWTVLIHLAGENNLYRFALEDLNEMEAGIPEAGNVNVYVLFDGIKDGDSCVYKIKRDPGGMNTTIVSEKVANDFIPASNEIDSGDVKMVSSFVKWAGANTKADHTMIGYWDHGSGIFHGQPNPITKGFGWDDKGTNLETADLTGLCNDFKAASGKPFAVVGFDACLMAHGEIAYQMKGGADYLVASEELEPGKGWDYKTWLASASNAAGTTPSAFASTLVDSYIASYGPGGWQSSGRDQVTLSALDINAYAANVVPAMNAFVGAANAGMAANKAALQAARANAQVFYNRDCADVGSFLANVKSGAADATVKAAATTYEAAYKSSIVREGHSNHFPKATGSVLYFPTPSQNINGSYGDASKIAFAATEWKAFLKNYR